MLGCHVEGQHADQRRRVRLVRRRRSHLHREEHSSGSARRDATGVAVQELTEACGPGEEPVEDDLRQRGAIERRGNCLGGARSRRCARVRRAWRNRCSSRWGRVPARDTDPTELDFLHNLPVELMWGVGPVTKARLAEIGVLTIGQLAKISERSLARLLGPAASEKLTALAWNRDPRQIKTHRRARSAGAQSALGKKPAEERVLMPALRLLADRVASRLRAKSRPGRTVTVRVRFGDLRSVTRSVTLDAPISATVVLAEIAEELVRKVLAQHPDEKAISLVAISVSQLQKLRDVQLELPLGLEDEERRPGSKRSMARWMADRAIDMIRDRFGREAIGYGSVTLEGFRSVPDEFRELAEKNL